MRYIIIVVIPVFFLLLAFSCEPITKYSDIPQVSFEEFQYDDTTLVINFIDGDGDLGDTTDCFFVSIMKKKNGVFNIHHFATSDVVGYPFDELPQMTGNNKTLKGIMKIKMNIFEGSGIMPADTFYFKFYIIDRNLHTSNTDSSRYLNFKYRL